MMANNDALQVVRHLRKGVARLRRIRAPMAARIHHDQVVVGLERLRQWCPAQACVGETVREHHRRLVPSRARIVEAHAIHHRVPCAPRCHGIAPLQL
jgi:hypothetical protein